MYPLSLKLGNPLEFKMALQQLGANIYYLCISQGLVFEDKEEVQPYLLLNLLYLLHCNQLGRYVNSTLRRPSLTLSINPAPTLVPSYATKIKKAVSKPSHLDTKLKGSHVNAPLERRGSADPELSEWEIVDDREEVGVASEND